MEHLNVPQFLGILVLILGTARLCGALAKAIGQPTVLGELIAGIILGPSVLGLVDPNLDVIHLLAEIGVILLLFAIGLETNLHAHQGGWCLSGGGHRRCRVAIRPGLCSLPAARLLKPRRARCRGVAHGHKRRDHGPRPLGSGPVARPGRPDHSRSRGHRRRHRPGDSGGDRRAHPGRIGHDVECGEDHRRGLRVPARDAPGSGG